MYKRAWHKRIMLKMRRNGGIMSNVYPVGNNRQLIIYAAGSNIFLRIAHWGGLERPIILATDYSHGLNECIYNDTLYYTYVSTDNSIYIKNIMENQSIYTIDGNEIHQYCKPLIEICNASLLFFYLKNNPVTEYNTLHCLSLTNTDMQLEAFPVPLPSCVTNISDYHICKADDKLILYVNKRVFFFEEIGHIIELKSIADISKSIENDYKKQIESLNKKYTSDINNINELNLKKIAACQAKIDEQAAVINSIKNQYNELMNVACQYKDEAIKWRSKFM